MSDAASKPTEDTKETCDTSASRTEDRSVADRRPPRRDEIDLLSVFPLNKVKAQILRGDGVGRISTGAVRLIGACSAMFVRDLAQDAASIATSDPPSAGEVPSGGTPDAGADAKDRPTSSYSSAKRGSSVESKGFIHRSFASDRRPTDVVVTLDHVKCCIENDGNAYDFLSEALREVSEASSPFSKARKRKVGGGVVSRQRKKSKGLAEGENTTRSNGTGRVGLPETFGDDGSVVEVNSVSSGAVKRAIADAEMSVPSSREIVEDDEDYD